MLIYETIPCEIEAARWNGDSDSEARFFCATYSLPPFEYVKTEHAKGLLIPALEGDHIASEGDYIIKGLLGEFYPYKPEVFHKKYKLKGR